MSLPSGSSLSVKPQGNRPPSSLSSRPSSRNTARTPTSGHRPQSSLAVNRPVSSLSTRPQSRFSLRPHSRHTRSRLIPACQTLVSEVTGLKEDGTDDDPTGELFQQRVEYAVKSLETTTINKAAATVDMGVIDRQISGLAMKARINHQETLGEALEYAYKSLKAHIEQQETDLDQDIKTAHIPDHLQFLLALSHPPNDVTIAKSDEYLDAVKNPRPPTPPLTWADILAEEPFEGDHWEGIFTNQNRDPGRDEWDSTPSLSPLNSDDLALDDEDENRSSFSDRDITEGGSASTEDDLELRGADKSYYIFEHRKQFEELQARQYWRDDWHTDAVLTSKFSLGEPSTLGPTLNRVLAQSRGFGDAQAMLSPERYINEDDMVREILMALQGNRNIVLEWREGVFKIVPNPPRLVHLTLASQESILSSLGKTATTIEHLRRFTNSALDHLTAPYAPATRLPKSTSCTREAFADAVADTIRTFECWCSTREEKMCRAYAGIGVDGSEEPLVVSLLDTEKSLRDEFASTFEVLLDIVVEVFGSEATSRPPPLAHISGRKHPAALTAALLDTLFANVQRHLERGDTVTSDALMRVFVVTAEPIWGMLGGWLKNGMGLGLESGGGLTNMESGQSSAYNELDEEFFIESSGVGVGMMGLGLLDPEFWKEGYALREIEAESLEESTATKRRKAIPRFLEHVAEFVLGSGKAVGLLRALDGFSKNSGTRTVFGGWESFEQLVGKGKDGGLFSVSIDTLSRMIHDELLSHCQAMGERLVEVLVQDCMLWRHLNAIEDIFLLRRGDAMSNFVDVVFNKMDSNQSWSDFHFLNTAFGDVVSVITSLDSKEWVNLSLVRFSYRGTKEKEHSIKRTVKAIDGVVLEYAVPFPLIYIFQPRTIQGYSDIFVYLLQIRRAKSVLERILVRDEKGRGQRLKEELKMFYAMRSRLSWFINTLLNFLTTYVIHADVSKFHGSFKKTTSLDEMVQLHDDHLEKIRGRCLLKPNTSALHRAIISILDMCLQFSDGFMTIAGETTTTLDISRQSISIRSHRSRRRRRQRRNVIGFSQHLDEQDDESSSEDEDDLLDLETHGDEPSISILGSSTASAVGDEDFFTRVERMSTELDGLIKFLRRGVESLAGGTSEAAAAFGVLAFALEDWDI